MAVVAVAAAVAAFMLANAAMLFLSIGLLVTSLVGSYSVKQLALKASLEQDTAKLQKIESGYEADNAQLKKELADLENEKKEWQKQELALKGEISQLQKVPAEMQSKVDTLSKDLQGYAAIAKQAGIDISQFNVSANNLDQLAKLVDTLVQQVAAEKAAAAALQGQVQQLTRANLDLKATLDQEKGEQSDVDRDIAATEKFIQQGARS